MKPLIALFLLCLTLYAQAAERAWPRLASTADEVKALLSLVTDAKNGRPISAEQTKAAEVVVKKLPAVALTGTFAEKAATALMRFGYFPCDLSLGKRKAQITLYGEQHLRCPDCKLKATRLSDKAALKEFVLLREGIGYGPLAAKTGAAENLKKGEVGFEDLNRYGIVGFFKNRSTVIGQFPRRRLSRADEEGYLIAVFLGLRGIVDSPELSTLFTEAMKGAKLDADTADLAKMLSALIAEKSMKPFIENIDDVLAKKATVTLFDFIAEALVKGLANEPVRERLDLPDLSSLQELVKSPRDFKVTEAFLSTYSEGYRDEAIFYNVATEFCAKGPDVDLAVLFGARHLFKVHKFLKLALEKAGKHSVTLSLDRGILEHAHTTNPDLSGDKRLDALEAVQRKELLEFFKTNK